MEMIVLIKKGVLTQQQLFMVISVLKIKGKLITCKIIYLLHCICHQMHCFREVFFPLCNLKSHFNNFKNGSDHIILKYSLYTVILEETDLVRLFKKIKIFM
jgi:hypothetical protein